MSAARIFSSNFTLWHHATGPAQSQNPNPGMQRTEQKAPSAAAGHAQTDSIQTASHNQNPIYLVHSVSPRTLELLPLPGRTLSNLSWASVQISPSPVLPVLPPHMAQPLRLGHNRLSPTASSTPLPGLVPEVTRSLLGTSPQQDD